jgi:hypothetical protein
LFLDYYEEWIKSPEAHGRVEFIIKRRPTPDLEFPPALHITEVKKSTILDAVAQNMFELAAAWEEGGCRTPIYGLATRFDGAKLLRLFLLQLHNQTLAVS